MPKMRKYVNASKQSPLKPVKWGFLLQEAIRLAKETQDPRVSYLEGGLIDPEVTLRRINVVCKEDLKREFS